jgi:hypothetical protein
LGFLGNGSVLLDSPSCERGFPNKYLC